MLRTLNQILPFGAFSLEAKLKGVAGYTGGGLFRYRTWPSGDVAYEADLRGLAGLRAELHVHGERMALLACRDGKASGQFDSRRGDPAIALAAGDIVEIRQHGCLILRGALTTRE